MVIITSLIGKTDYRNRMTTFEIIPEEVTTCEIPF